ncbi:hypothetical protein, partial [Burkholderia thailandensis]|uniref:hypothetical protein n=1 Tax=Burkholderia thailandensis TaxID=57975 RepID=UPI00217D38B9
SLSSNLVPEVPCDRAIPPPDIHKIRRQVTQSFSKAPRFSAMNLFFRRPDGFRRRGARKAENTRIIFCDVLTHARRYRVYHGNSTTVQAQKRWLWRS